MTQTTQNQTSALDSLVGDGKKFASVEDLAAGKIKADTHITRLEDETKTLRTELTSAINELNTLKNKTSILERLNANQSDNTDDNSSQTNNQQPEPKVVGLSEEDVVKVVENRELKQRAENNKREVDNVLTKVFGADAKGFLVQKAAELGISTDELVATAVRSPRAFFNMIGIDPNPRTQGTGYVGNRQSAVNSNEPVKNNKYYEDLKKKMGIRAFINDKNLQAERYRQIDILGDAWDS